MSERIRCAIYTRKSTEEGHVDGWFVAAGL